MAFPTEEQREAEIARQFEMLPELDQDTIDRITVVRGGFLHLAQAIMEHGPARFERFMCLVKLREADWYLTEAFRIDGQDTDDDDGEVVT